MDETKGAIFGGGWAFILFQIIAYFAGWSGLWTWLVAFLLLAVGAAAGYFAGKQMSG